MTVHNSLIGAELLARLKHQFEAIQDPQRAKKMQSYMKSAIPYWGIPMDKMKQICKDVFSMIQLNDVNKMPSLVGVLSDKNLVLSEQQDLIDLIRYIWFNATHREEKYAAIEILRHKISKKYKDAKIFPLYEEMIVTGAWWDLVDAMAHLVGELLAKDPLVIKPRLLVFSKSDNLWKRRIAIISQLDFGEKTDETFLLKCIEPSIDSREFFLRKAIGWALRQHARVAPLRVLDYTEKNKHRLSPLSYKEATRVIFAQEGKKELAQQE